MRAIWGSIPGHPRVENPTYKNMTYFLFLWVQTHHMERALIVWVDTNTQYALRTQRSWMPCIYIMQLSLYVKDNTQKLIMKNRLLWMAA